jgi:hypothetical protein
MTLLVRKPTTPFQLLKQWSLNIFRINKTPSGSGLQDEHSTFALNLAFFPSLSARADAELSQFNAEKLNGYLSFTVQATLT